MALEIIPDFLREPIRKSLAEKPREVWRENSTETGPPIRRKLYDRAPSLFNVTWNLDEIEAQTFDGWFKLKINQGADSFTIPLLTPSAGVVDHECTFKGNPQYRQVNRRVMIRATLEARFKQFDSDENIQTLLDVMQDLFDGGDTSPSLTIEQFQIFMQQSLPDKWAAFL